MKLARTALITIPLLALGMLAMTQPEGAPPPSADRQGPRGRVGLELQLDPEALRIRLQRMIDRGQAMVDRGRGAIEKLDAGASPSEVLSELRPVETPRRLRAGDTPNTHATPMGDRPVPDADRPTPSDDREQIHAFLREEFPDLWKNVQPMIEQNPRSADRLVGRMAPKIREILVLRRTQPDLAKIKTLQMHAGFDFVEAARLYRVALSDPNASESQRERSLADVRTYAEQRFDTEMQAKQLEISRLESRLDELRASLSELEAQRDQEVSRMVLGAQRNAERLARQQRQRQQQKDDQSGDN